MAEGKILFNDLFDANLLKQIAELRGEIDSTLKSLQAMKTTLPKSGNKPGDTEKLNAVQKERIRLQEKLNTLETQEYQANEKLKQQIKERTAQKAAENSEYKKLSLSLSENIKKYKDLAAAEKATTAEGKKLLQTIQDQDKKIKQIDASVGQHQRNVGNYTSALKGLGRQFLGALGITAGITGFINVLKDGIRTMISFELAMAKVKSISGATGDEFRLLTQDAKRLGQITRFTASEVAGLQLEYAKIGFSTSEILNATEATVDLATATGESLARAAEVAGATLRGFGLDTIESKRVVDVMALSFSKSALNLERFAEAMKYVAPPAAALKIPIEQVTAQLSKLADAGIHGSMAGTALRMIYLKMAQTGLDASSAFEQLANNGMTLADANDEVGQRAQTALLILAKQRDEVSKLSEVYVNAAGSADKMAGIIENTTEGSLKSLSSAWEGFILSVGKSDGFFKTTIDYLTDFVRMLGSANESILNVVMNVTGAAKTTAIKEAANQIKVMTESLIKNGLSETEAAGRAFELYMNNSQNVLDKLTEKQKYLNDNMAEWREKGMTANIKEAESELPLLLHQIDTLNAEMQAMATENEKRLINEMKLKAERDAQAKQEIENKKIESEQNEKNYEKELKAKLALEQAEIDIRNKIAEIDQKALEGFTDFLDKELEAIDNYLAEFDEKYIQSVNKRQEADKEARDYTTEILDRGKDQDLLRMNDELAILEQNLQEKIGDTKQTEEAILKIKEEIEAKKLAVTADTLGAAASLFEENTAAYKALASAQAIINTLLTVTEIITAWSGTGPWGYAIGAAQAAIALASGMATVAKINGVKFEDGEVDIKGRRHSQGGIVAEIEGGESVINRTGTRNAKDTLELINSGRLTDNMIIPMLAMKAGAQHGGVSVNNSDVVNEIKQTNQLLSKFKFYSQDGKKVLDIHGNLVRYV